MSVDELQKKKDYVSSMTLKAVMWCMGSWSLILSFTTWAVLQEITVDVVILQFIKYIINLRGMFVTLL